MGNKISVLQKHIDDGCRGDEHSCPVALALTEDGYKDPSVLPFGNGVQISYVVNGPWNSTSCWINSYDMYHKLVWYDEQGELEPFEFEMPLDTRGRLIGSFDA